MSITLRQARPEDAAAIYAMIYELAVYDHTGGDPGNALWRRY